METALSGSSEMTSPPPQEALVRPGPFMQVLRVYLRSGSRQRPPLHRSLSNTPLLPDSRHRNSWSQRTSGSTGQLNEPDTSSSSLTNSQVFRSNPAINTGDTSSDTSRQASDRGLPTIPASPELPLTPKQRPPPHNGLNGSSMSSERALCTTGEVDSLRNEVLFLRKKLAYCQDTINQLQQREKTLRDRLSEQAQKRFERGSTNFENLNLGENRPTSLIRRYGNLYSESRLDAFDALDDLPEIAEFDDLKGKLLFSVIVLAFRSVQRSSAELKGRLKDLLCLPNFHDKSLPEDKPTTAELEPIVNEMEELMGVYLKKSIKVFNLSRNIEEVCNQVYATLFDYPRLRQCQGLRNYIAECVRISWALTVQNPPFIISYEAKTFSPDTHTRFHTSDPDSVVIKSVMWPALFEGDNSGQCAFKGVVVT